MKDKKIPKNEDLAKLEEIKKKLGGLDAQTLLRLHKAREAVASVNIAALDMTRINRALEEFKRIQNIKIPDFKTYNNLIEISNLYPDYITENFNKIESLKNDLKNTSIRNEEILKEISNESIAEEDKIIKIKELEENLEKMEEKNQLIHITSRIHPTAVKKILDDSEFREKFRQDTEFEASVISIDIRRSTDLMLEANSPKEYSNFIFELINGLKLCVINNFGIFDKFTGDGILAFFPKFYSSDYSIIFAQKTAIEAHELFSKIYKKYSDSFDLILSDVGLGIGIDFGKVYMYESPSELSIVGKPVVYACRFSSTKSYTTLNNQGALKEIKNCLKPEDFEVSKELIEIKNKGICQGYIIEIDYSKINFKLPDWH